MRMARNVEPQITYREPRASRTRERSFFMVGDQMQDPLRRSSHRRTSNRGDNCTGACTSLSGLYLLVDALLRLGGLEQQIDELVGEELVAGQRLLVRAPHGGLAAWVEHGTARLAFGVPDHLRHFEPALHQHAEIVIDGGNP